MIKRIDFLIVDSTQYDVLNHFTEKLYEAFQRKKIPARLVFPGNGMLQLDRRDLPTLTVGFNGIPEINNVLLCDQIGVPHLALLVDSPVRFKECTSSELMVIGCDDRSGPRILREMGFSKSFFLPHAVEPDLSFDPTAERIYDISFFASYIDYEAIRHEWQTKFPPSISKAMEEAIAGVFSDNSTSFVEILMAAISKHVPESKGQPLYQNPYILDLCGLLELYIKGKERADLIKSIKGSHVHIFGNGSENKSWKQELKGQKNVTIHPALNFEETLNAMKQSKIILNSSIKNKEGAHERIFAGLACGALVVTSDNPYIREQFVDGQDILLFKHSKLEEVDDVLIKYLKSRKVAAESGRIKVMKHHTWDQRADTILEAFSTFSGSLPIPS